MKKVGSMASRYQEIMASDSRKVQQKGEITLPAGWRDQHGVEKGDAVAIERNDDGTLTVIPPDE